MSDLELRYFNGRAAKPLADNDNRLSGQAAPFMSPTLIGGAFREQIDPRSWNKTLADGDQVLLDNHNASRPLARRSAGTLQIQAGHNGVQWRAEASDTSYAKDVLTNVKDGNYGGCSFSFEVTKNGDRWEEDTPDGIPLRTLMDIKVREISIVTFPAYTNTSVANRCVEVALEARNSFWLPTMEHYEEILRDAADGDGPGPVSHMGAKKPYGDVKYADPKNGKYPIDTEEHVRAAWSYINMPKNAAKYPLNGVTLSEVKGRIRAAAAHFGIKISDDDNKNAETPQYIHELNDYFRSLTVGYDEETAKRFREHLDWSIQDFRSQADGEPDESTLMVSDEDAALIVKRYDEKLLARHESRKASFVK